MKLPTEQVFDDFDLTPIKTELWHRYLYAAQFVENKKVLDIASGSGLGSNLLAETAAKVTGVDPSEDLVTKSRKMFERENLRFLAGSLENIPIQGKEKFDVITSFETIEHLDEKAQQLFLGGVLRLLRKKGILIVSVPNRRHLSEAYKKSRSPHSKEFYEKEFIDALRNYFPEVLLLGQQLCSTSNLWRRQAHSGKEFITRYEGHSATQEVLSNSGLERANYFIAVCSWVKADCRASSILIDHSLAVTPENYGSPDIIKLQARKIIRGLSEKVAQLDRDVVNRGSWGRDLTQQLEVARQRNIELSDQLQERAIWASNLDQEIQGARARIAELTLDITSNQKKVSELNKEITERDDRSNKLNEELRIARLRIEELELVLAHHLKLRVDLDGPVNPDRDSLLELSSKFESRRVGQELLENDLEVARKKVAQLSEEVERRGNWGISLERELQLSRSRVTELSDEVERRGNWGVSLERELQLSRSRVTELSDEVDRRGNWGANLERELQLSRSRVTELSDEVDRRGKWGASLEHDLKEIRGKIVGLSEEVERRGNWGISLERSLQEANSKIAELSSEVERRGDWGISLERSLQEANSKITELSDEVELRGVRASILDSELTAALTKIEELSKEVTGSHSEISKLYEALEEWDNWGSNLDDQLKFSQVEVIELDKALVERNEQLSHANNKIELFQLQEAINADHIARLEVELKEAQNTNSELNQEVHRRGEWGLGLESELTQARVKILELDQEVVRRGEWGLALDDDIKHARLQISRMSSTISWRITHPLRLCGRIIPKLRLGLTRVSGTPNAKSIVKTQLSAARSSRVLLGSSTEKLSIPTSLEPVVSVIIPIYGQIDLTLRCLESIKANPPLTPFEIIIVDDYSPDDSLDRLQSVGGIKLIQNFENKGFIHSCNIGAEAAVGDYVCFLNNDTEVSSGWLDELVRTFQEFPGTGLAGSKLIYPDGTLQEAGGIIWNDGSAWNFGRGNDAALPIYNYAREVDYCSGASIMVPTNLFWSLGGFDDHYFPAYCEDSDLALKIRDNGYRVIYQPLSIVVHHEGATCGNDVSFGVKAYQSVNLNKQFDRWKETLKSHEPNGVNVDRAKDRTAKRRVLLIDKCTPTPDQDGGSIDIFNLALLFRESGFQVTFIPEDNFLYMPTYTQAMQRVGIEMLYAPYCTSVKSHLKDYGDRYDLVMLVRGEVVAKHLATVRKHCPNAKVIYHTVDLHFLRMLREAELLKDSARNKAADAMKAIELAAIQSVDATTVLSSVELEYLHQQIPDPKIHLLPFCRPSRATSQKFESRRHVVFVGGYGHPPNVDAVLYFVSEVMPILRTLVPGIQFYIVGSKLPDQIRQLAAEDVIVVGYVKDLSPLLDSMRISVAPLRYGAGIKGKISEAMGMGLPNVATSIAAEGMGLTDGENILIADGAEALASSIARLYEDKTLWNKISRQGIAFAKEAWSPETVWKYLEILLRDLGVTTERMPQQLPTYVARTKILQKNRGLDVLSKKAKKRV